MPNGNGATNGNGNGNGNKFMLNTNSPVGLGLVIAIISMLAGAVGGYAGNWAKMDAHISNCDIHWSGGQLAEKFVTNTQMVQYLADMKSDLKEEREESRAERLRLEAKIDDILKNQRNSNGHNGNGR